ncbi:hypothetical protein [Kiloniella antarctica]|uniref:HipA-like C-terminal domain-containing protein n=1 Tax=Kiloniella antarctica TaxID=1550907 RepID=A0ABW5BNG6_9PROT
MNFDHAEIYAPEFGNRHLSNHFPVAAFAFKKLGAKGQALERLNQSNLKALDLIRDVSRNLKITDDNFVKYLGEREAYSGYFS